MTIEEACKDKCFADALAVYLSTIHINNVIISDELYRQEEKCYWLMREKVSGPALLNLVIKSP